MKFRTPQFANILFILFIAIAIGSCEEPPQQVEPPKQTISYKEAKLLQDTFIETRANVLNDTLGFVDTREFWFSLDTLKKYIEYVEQEAGNQGLENLGMRVYFAAYPENSNYPQPGYSTVFFVPTSANGKGLQRGIMPIQQKDENIEGIDPLNFGHGGQPPHDLK